MKFHRTRRWTPGKQVALIAAVALLGGLVWTGSASAVHGYSFQLDGDVSASTTTTLDSVTQGLDWDSFFNANGTKKALPTGFTASSFTPDLVVNPNGSFNTSDATTYTTGSKDTLPISTGWQCASSNNVNSKVDIMNAYSAAFTAANGHQLLYFGLERNTNTGDGNVAFWFLQNKVGCDSNGGTASFTGDHADGDLLIVSAFTNGGSVSGVDVYRWNGGANGTLGTTPVAHGVDCKTTASTQASPDTACATVNGPTNGTAGTITTPWTTANAKDGVGTKLRTSEFFEGGLDLTANNLGDKCFNVFTGDTRSSQSLTATLFDYALGTLGECTSTTTTIPTPSGSSTIPTSGTLSASDSATVTVTGISTFSGALTFNLCGPFTLASTTTCTTGGVQIGTAQTITASGTYPSDSVTVTSAGRYCWRADFSGDTTAGVPGSSDGGPITECFTVNPRQPTLTTQAGSSPVNFGSAVTDTATLGNTANQPGTGGLGNGSINPTTAGAAAGGTISFTLYKSDCTTVATGTGGPFPLTAAVSGDGTYGPVSFTPDAPGTYHWVATYGGNLPNTLASLASASVCGVDPNEDVIVRQIPTSIATAQSAYPNDSATITSSIVGDNLPSGGTVIFRLYGPANGNTALANCTAAGDVVNSGGLLFKQTNTSVGGTHSATTSTTNTSVSVNVSDTYYWSVTYATGDTAHTGRQSSCAENTVLTFNNDAGPGTLFP
jgi:hypothetical protein